MNDGAPPELQSRIERLERRLAREREARRRAEDLAEDVMRTLYRSNQELEEFAHVVSHDLRVPIRHIISLLQLIRDEHRDSLDPGAAEYIEMGLRASRRAARLMEDWLSYARTGRESVEEEPTNIADVVGEVLEALGNGATAKHEIKIVSPLPTIVVRRNELTTIFHNLLSNAVKFQDRDRPLVVEISATEESTGWSFSIRDNGVGFDPKHSRRIFRPFQRLQMSYHGSGIGLSIVEKIVFRNRGAVSVDSTPGVGSTFRFSVNTDGGSK